METLCGVLGTNAACMIFGLIFCVHLFARPYREDPLVSSTERALCKSGKFFTVAHCCKVGHVHLHLAFEYFVLVV